MGYVLAGIAGEAEPGDDRLCSGRFALVSLNENGSPRRALLASAPERDRFCAKSLTSAFRQETGEWVVSGFATRYAEPSRFYPLGPSSDTQTYVLRLTDDGEPDPSFGERGVVRGAFLVGRAGETYVTNRLERVTADGDVRDDLLEVQESVYHSWSGVVAERDTVVVFDAGLPLSFQTFEADDPRSPSRLRALTPQPNYPERTIELGNALFNWHDVALHGGRLYVVLEGRKSRIVAADAREGRLATSFGQRGAVPLFAEDYVAGAALTIDDRGRLVVAFSTIAPSRYSLHLRRFSKDGVLDREFGGLVRQGESEISVTDVLVDAAERIVVLDRFGAAVTRVTPGGRLDPTFGRGGVVSLADVAVCQLAAARRNPACLKR
jgi:hypothetical protein